MSAKNTRSYKRNETVVIPPVNAYSSRKEWEEDCWRKLISSREWPNLITPYERHNIVMRAAVAYRLRVGMSYTDIGRELWLAPQTISTIKKGIREKRYRSYADRGATERKKKIYTRDRSTRAHPKIGIPRKTKYGTLYL